MPLAIAEVVPGTIAYFDAQVLNQDAAVIKRGDPVTRVGATSQFLCYAVKAGVAYWAPLTGTPRPERLPIDPGWLSVRYGALGSGGVSLQDGKNTYSGPIASFVAASQGEALHGPRPIVSAAGIAATLAEVTARGGQTP